MPSFVTGRLKRALHEWKLIYLAQLIIEVIEFGYKLPFIHIPAPKFSSLALSLGFVFINRRGCDCLQCKT